MMLIGAEYLDFYVRAIAYVMSNWEMPINGTPKNPNFEANFVGGLVGGDTSCEPTNCWPSEKPR